MLFFLFCHFALCVSYAISDEIQPPNIVFIVADDLGWDDVSFHGSDQILTPNIDTIAYTGVICHQYYTDTLGTPSRSALFTGKYPLRLGTQSTSIKAAEDRGIPITERLLPAYLQDLGYSTHLIGKWHVGKSREHYLPTYRGFDTFYGFLGGSVDYFTYNQIQLFNHTSFYGQDFFENTEPVEDVHGHLTEVLTQRAEQVIRDHNTSTPLYLHVSHAAPGIGGALATLQPPADAIAANHHIAHSARRLYAGQVTTLDKSVGQIISALAEREILNDTIIVFVSDNGAAPTENFGSNLPLRGVKNTPWEGGARSIALLWNPSLNPGVWNGLFHVTDWLPTLVAAAGGNVSEPIDGFNQWDALTKGVQPKRNDALITIDDLGGWAALREGDFKMIVGDLKDEFSSYEGLELKAVKRAGPDYETMLLESETNRVFLETLDLGLDMDDVFSLRNSTNVLLGITSDPSAVPCMPTKDNQVISLQCPNQTVETNTKWSTPEGIKRAMSQEMNLYRAKGCLFNISDDPLESRDLWQSSPEVVRRMSLRLRSLWAELKPRWVPQPDIRANPALHDYVWYPWLKNDEVVPQNLTTAPVFPMQVSMGELQYLVDLNMNMFKQRMFDSLKYMGNSFVKSVGGLFPCN